MAGDIGTLTGKTFVIIDGHYLMHRNYHTHNLSVRTRKGPLNIGAVYGFMRDLLKFQKTFKAAIVIVAWDSKNKTWRHRLTEKYIKKGVIKKKYAYKANRKKDKEFIKDFGRQKKILQKMLRTVGVMQCQKNGYEADDIVGTYATAISKEYGHCIIISTDRDYYQLLDHNTCIYKPNIDEYYSQLNFTGEWELSSPKSWILVGSLCGDAGDNIQGIKGIGEKTACKLIKTYGYTPMIDTDIDDKWCKKIRKLRKRVKLARRLKEIKTDVKVPKLRRMHGVHGPALAKMFKKYQFKSLNILEYKKFFGERKIDEDE